MTKEKFSVDLDETGRVLTICGIRYAYDVFESVAFGKVGTRFEIYERSDGVLTLASIDPLPIPRPPLYARAGEHVTCESGHRVATMKTDVMVGDCIHPTIHMTLWHQHPPDPNDRLETILCKRCGGQFAREGHALHFELGGWRKNW